MRRTGAFAAACAVLAVAASPADALTVTVHYAPAENLETVDVALIRRARRSIDVAAFVLTDRGVIAALADATKRGVAVRLVLDASQDRTPDRLAVLASVTRLTPRGPYMHLKAYAVDGRQLRTGSANLSPSGLKRQDNDLLVIEDPDRAAAFERTFDDLWGRSQPVATAAGVPLPEAAVAGRASAKHAREAAMLSGARGSAPKHDATRRPGITARCRDGAASLARTHSGACSRHGGVAVWYR